MKLWDKGKPINFEIEKFTVGDDFLLDIKLAKFDLSVNFAHAKMLNKIGILNEDELKKIVSSLEKVKLLIAKGQFQIKSNQEDIHTAIEEFLTKDIGEAGKKIHTARSRNDQVLTDILLYCKEELDNQKNLINSLIESIETFAKKNVTIPIPGYTHMQKAMPYSVKGWALTFKEMLEDDLKSLEFTQEKISVCPLGSAAAFGVPIEIDKEMTAKELGFKKTFDEPLYTQNSKGKFEVQVLFAINQAMMTLNKLSTDLTLFTMAEFDYFSLPSSFTTGSSIMPQKKNYDVLELVRAKTSSYFVKITEINSIYTNLISGYNRDSQLMKKPLIEGIEISKSVIEIMTFVINNLVVNEFKLKLAMSEELYATEKAMELVKQGIPFREAYKKIGEEYKEK